MPDKFNNDGPVTKVNVGRLTNGIFVFTLLLIFKNIKLPSFGDYMLSVPADKFGLMQIPDIMSFLNAFIIVSMFWLIFFQIFNKIKKFNRVLLYLHICLLMMIIFIPIISHLYQLYPDNIFILLIFHMNMLITGLFILAEWKYSRHNSGLLISSLTPGQISCITRELLFVPITAVIGLSLSLFDIPYTRNLYYLTIVVIVLYAYHTRSTGYCNYPGVENE